MTYTLLEMKGRSSSSDIHVASPEQCRILLSPVYRDLIKRLLMRPHTLSELSTFLETDLNNVYYRVKKLESFELVKVASNRSRRGKPIKWYVMGASMYRLPFANTSKATLEELIFGQISERQALFKKYFMERLAEKLNANSQNASILMKLENDALVMNLEADEILRDDPTIVFWRPIFIDESQIDSLFSGYV